jgi:hypothetical protein
VDHGWLRWLAGWCRFAEGWSQKWQNYASSYHAEFAGICSSAKDGDRLQARSLHRHHETVPPYRLRQGFITARLSSDHPCGCLALDETEL